MAIVAIYSVKGGVGKTTLAANLAWCSAMISQRQSLLWDLDASGGAGFLMGVDPANSRPAGKMFSHDRDPKKLTCATPFSRLDMLPSDESLRGLDGELRGLGKHRKLARIGKNLTRDYERIFLDCPPVMNELSTQIIRTADLIIVPLPPSPLSTRAFQLVADQVRQTRKPHPPILPVLSMVDMRRNLHREAREAAPDWPVIPFASAIEQCAVRRQPVGAFAPRSPAAQGFARLWTAIERKLARIEA